MQLSERVCFLPNKAIFRSNYLRANKANSQRQTIMSATHFAIHPASGTWWRCDDDVQSDCLWQRWRQPYIVLRCAWFCTHSVPSCTMHCTLRHIVLFCFTAMQFHFTFHDDTGEGGKTIARGQPRIGSKSTINPKTLKVICRKRSWVRSCGKVWKLSPTVHLLPAAPWLPSGGSALGSFGHGLHFILVNLNRPRNLYRGRRALTERSGFGQRKLKW